MTKFGGNVPLRKTQQSRFALPPSARQVGLLLDLGKRCRLRLVDQQFAKSHHHACEPGILAIVAQADGQPLGVAGAGHAAFPKLVAIEARQVGEGFGEAGSQGQGAHVPNPCHGDGVVK